MRCSRRPKSSMTGRTGETVLIDERLVPTFKFSNDIKDKINSLEGILGEASVQPELETEDEIVHVSSDDDSI